MEFFCDFKGGVRKKFSDLPVAQYHIEFLTIHLHSFPFLSYELTNGITNLRVSNMLYERSHMYTPYQLQAVFH